MPGGAPRVRVVEAWPLASRFTAESPIPHKVLEVLRAPGYGLSARCACLRAGLATHPDSCLTCLFEALRDSAQDAPEVPATAGARPAPATAATELTLVLEELRGGPVKSSSRAVTDSSFCRTFRGSV